MPLYVKKAAKIAEKAKKVKKTGGVARTRIVVLAWVLAKCRLNLFTAPFFYVRKAGKIAQSPKNAKNRRSREDHDCRPRLGSGKMSLELVHRDIFDRSSLGACFLFYPISPLF
jgi:hypothetical protein